MLSLLARLGVGLPLLAALALATPAPGAADEAPAAIRERQALDQARAAAKALSDEIRGLLMQELKAGGFEGAAAVCARTAQARTAEYRSRTGNDIRRVSLRQRNPANRPDAFEQRVLELFDRMPVEARPEAEHWEVLRQNDVLTLRYLKPLVASSMCLTCHGDKKGMPAAVRALIEKEYPDDRATGYSTGDVRGAISVKVQLR